MKAKIRILNFLIVLITISLISVTSIGVYDMFNSFNVKNLATQEQVNVNIEELSEYLDKNLED